MFLVVFFFFFLFARLSVCPCVGLLKINGFARNFYQRHSVRFKGTIRAQDQDYDSDLTRIAWTCMKLLPKLYIGLRTNLLHFMGDLYYDQ